MGTSIFYATDGTVGVDLTSKSSSPQFQTGTHKPLNDNKVAVYLIADETITASVGCHLAQSGSANWEAVAATATAQATLMQHCGQVAAGEHFWAVRVIAAVSGTAA